MLKVFASLVVYVILASSQTALGNDVYRCGNVYQDTPCKNGASKPINAKPERKNVSKTSQTAQISTSANTDCKLRGESAKSIANMREKGHSEDKLKANAADSYTSALVTDVYKRTGSAFQIQNAIERECVQNQQKQSLTSKWMVQAKRLLGVGTAQTNANVKNTTSLQPEAITRTVPAKPALTQNELPAELEPEPPTSAPLTIPTPPPT